jgi:hypothetical protein
MNNIGETILGSSVYIGHVLATSSGAHIVMSMISSAA